MIEVQMFNASGDVTFADRFSNAAGVLMMARRAFGNDCGMAINGVDCFTFAEAERAIIKTTAEVAA